jgi:hypothetical protein
MSLIGSTNAILEKRVSELQGEVSKLRQELGHRQKELNVLETALRKLPSEPPISQALFQQGEPAPNLGLRTRGPIVFRKTVSIGHAARNILRDCGEPMRCLDILKALHAAGREEIRYESLNATLSKYARHGKLRRLELGVYALRDEVVERTHGPTN